MIRPSAIAEASSLFGRCLRYLDLFRSPHLVRSMEEADVKRVAEWGRQAAAILDGEGSIQ
jgi:hypothetical protein